MSTAITGSCGEHFVAAFLAGHGLVVGLPRAGTRGSDLFVAEAGGGPPIRVQVKTAKSAAGPYKKELIHSWETSLSIINQPDKSLWYAFVNLNHWPLQDLKLPEVFFVPSPCVVECLMGQLTQKRSFFWMPDTELKKYNGGEGLKLLRGALTPK